MSNMLAPTMPRSASAGFLFLRIVVGVAFVLHGYPKIVHPTTWMGSHSLLMPTTGEALFLVPPWLQATAAAVEFFGGIALLVGLLTRLAGLALAVDMLVACVFSELPRGTPFVGSGHTLEPNLAYLAVGLLMLLTGPGAISLDAVLGAPRKPERRHRYHDYRGPNLVMPG